MLSPHCQIAKAHIIATVLPVFLGKSYRPPLKCFHSAAPVVTNHAKHYGPGTKLGSGGFCTGTAKWWIFKRRNSMLACP